ncbi:MAG: alpha/beta hydrolase [Traorella sp.]
MKEKFMIIQNTLTTSLLPMKNISYAIILPTTCKYTLLWLHGYQERSFDLLKHPFFEQFACDNQCAIVFPDVPDTYYLNQKWNDCYTEDFLIDEFIPYLSEQYSLPINQLFLAGISMGGFGSILIGVHYPTMFKGIVSISGAFIVNDVMIGNPGVVGSLSNIDHFRNLFGDIISLSDDPSRNPEFAIQSLENKKVLPPVFLSCGRDDLLYQRNIKLYQMMRGFNFDVTWDEANGGHSWDFFEGTILRAFEWLFPRK